MKLRFCRWLTIGGAIAVTGFAGIAAASAPTPPVNDNYIDSLDLQQGKVLDSKDTIEDIRNTALATTQTDIFHPPSKGGPAELTTCKGVPYGHTIWYDFHPNANGTVRIRTSGYDNVISLYTYSVHTLIPRRVQCVHTSNFPNEELDAKVGKGANYTIQIGGASGASGTMQFLFDYFIAPPKRLTAVATLSARATSVGIAVTGLSVQSVRGTRVEVDCGSHCQPEIKKIVAHAKSTTVTFPHLGGTQLPSKSTLQVRVTAPGSIGTVIQFTAGVGSVARQTFCTEPGSRKLRTKCH